MPRRLPLALLGVAAVAALLVAAVFLLGGGNEGATPNGRSTVPDTQAGGDAEPFADPYAYDPDEREDFEARAARGFSHVVFANAPGGVRATAERVMALRDDVEAAADDADVDPDLVEALVFLESGGVPEAIAPGDPSLQGAVGLTQILAETGRNLLGMQVDAAASAKLTRRIRREARRGRERKVRALAAERRRVDERFDPKKALAAMGRYLEQAKDRFDDRDDLALVSYHMGMGNLEDVLEAFDGGERHPFAEVYFDSSPTRHRRAWSLLAGFGDDSSNYYWKLLAAREVLRLAREDEDELVRLIALHAAKNSAEEVLHPAADTEQFARPSDLADAYEDGGLRALPDDPRGLGVRVDDQMGELAKRDQRRLYRGLRPEALALVLYVAAGVREQTGDRSALTLTSSVRDRSYQRRLIGSGQGLEATRAYSLHTTGFSFDVLRTYSSRKQALAFQFWLDRLQALDVLSWVREPAAIHVTVGEDAERLTPLLDRIGTGA